MCFARTGVKVKAPGLDWAEYFRGAALATRVVSLFTSPRPFSGESALVGSAALETWKDWLAFHLIEAYAVGLPKAFSDEHFAFFGKMLSGTPEQPARRKRGVDLVNQKRSKFSDYWLFLQRRWDRRTIPRSRCLAFSPAKQSLSPRGAPIEESIPAYAQSPLV